MKVFNRTTHSPETLMIDKNLFKGGFQESLVDSKKIFRKSLYEKRKAMGIVFDTYDEALDFSRKANEKGLTVKYDE